MAYHVDKLYLDADTMISEEEPTYNYGTRTIFEIGWIIPSAPPTQGKVLIYKDFTYYLEQPLIEVIKVELFYFAGWGGAAETPIEYYKMLKPFYEGLQNGAIPGGGEDASTWNHQNYNGTVLWNTAGVGYLDADGGHDLGWTVIQPGIAAWHSGDFTQAYRDLKVDEQYGWLLSTWWSMNDNFSWYSSEHADPYKPYFEITYLNRGERPVPGIQRVTADPLGARNSHHLRLFRLETDDSLRDEVGLILCDANAEKNFKSLDVVNTPQESLKISSGATEHSDFEPPYSSLEFDDWSLGRGFSDHNKQKNAYLDGNAMFTVKEDYIYPCGKAQQSLLPTGYMKVDYRLTEAQLGHEITAIKWNVHGVTLWAGDEPEDWGTTFFVDESQANCTSFIMEMQAHRSFPDQDMPNLVLKIYDVTPVPGTATLAWINANPDCYLPNLSSQVGGDMTMTAESLEGLVDSETRSIVWNRVVSGVVQTFSLTVGKLYYAVLVCPSSPTAGNIFTSALYDGNWYEWAQEIISDDSGTSWVATGWCGVHWEFYITGEDNDFKAHFGEINRCLHVGLEYLNGDAGIILRNGEQGLGVLYDYDVATQKGLFRAEGNLPLVYDNQILRLLEGPGSDTNRDWARIVDMSLVSTETDIEIVHQFGMKDETQTLYSKYVIQNSLEFTQVSVSPAIDQPISDVLSAMGALYVCFGEKDNVHRLRYKYNFTAPSVTLEWVDEQYWADMMCQQTRAGNNYIWRIRSLLSQIVPANAVNLRDTAIDYALDFDVHTEIYVGNTEYRINSWAIYGDDPHLWILKEDKPYEIIGEDVYEFRNSAMANMVDSRNGRAAMQHDTYLHFAFHSGVQRWHYNGDLLNHGPEAIGPAGLPWKRQGSFADFTSYGETLVGAFDGGEQGYSSILAWNGSGWCELYRSPQVNQRILSCYVQSMDGKPVDWLWFSMGSKIMRLPVSANPLSQMNDDYFYYPFAKEATLDSSWISLGLKDVPKYINKFSIESFKAPSFYDIPVDGNNEPICESPVINGLTYDEELNPDGNIYYTEGVTIGWRTNPCENFVYYTDGIQDPLIMIGEAEANAIVDASAKQIQYRLGIISAYDRYPIVIDTVVMDSIVRLPHKSQIKIQFRLRDNDVDRLDQPDPYASAKEKYDYLEECANQAAPVWGQLDAKLIGERKFFIDQGSLQVIDKLKDQNIETWIMTMVLKEA